MAKSVKVKDFVQEAAVVRRVRRKRPDLRMTGVRKSRQEAADALQVAHRGAFDEGDYGQAKRVA